MEVMMDSQGVGYPMASAILKFIRPDVFPIIAVRAYLALTTKKITYSQCILEVSKNYTKALMQIAEQYPELMLRGIDEQVYCFDKEKNKNI